MKLFICEKPSQAKDIAAVLGVSNRTEFCFEGNGLAVTWCVGHLLELAPPDFYCDSIKPWRMEILPIIPKQWSVLPQEKTKKQLNAIGKLLKKAQSVVVATDADREGDVIGREVLDYFNYQGSVERLWLSALDEESIKKALQTIRPGSATQSLYQAGLGRQRADWLMGMNLTMAVSCLFGTRGQGVLSVGRVQTPTLKLVVDRDNAIEHFKPKEYFLLKARCVNQRNESFWLDWDLSEGCETITDSDGYVTDFNLAQFYANRLCNKEGYVVFYEEQLKTQPAPLCFSLSSLQKTASNLHGFGAKEILDIAQSLYERHKAITYPRTDCDYLPKSQFLEVNDVLNALKVIDPSLSSLINRGNSAHQSRVWNDKKITAHHAIIPTRNSNVVLTQMSEKEQKIYDLIRRRYIAQFFGEYEYLAKRTCCMVDDEPFVSSCASPKAKGWKEVLADYEEQEDQQINGELPQLLDNEKIFCQEIRIDKKNTKPPARFTEGSLITAMKSVAKYVDNPQLKKVLKETSGIGTEATRANILETLINRDYLKRQGKQLVSTPKGRELIQILPSSITNPATTALWEQVLEDIAQGQQGIDDFLDDQCDTLSGMLEQLVSHAATHKATQPSVHHACPECQKPLVKRQGKTSVWWGCSGFPECKTQFIDKKGVPHKKQMKHTA